MLRLEELSIISTGMLSRIGSNSFRSCSIVVQINRSVVGRLSSPYQKNGIKAFRLFGTSSESTDNKTPSSLSNDNGYTPEGAVFTNPKIGSEWIYREEKDTGRKYYINTKTNEILYNRTRDSELAPRWKRFAAAAIDMGISVGMSFFYVLICSGWFDCWRLDNV